MKIKELAEGLKSRPGMRIRITHVSLQDDFGRSLYTESLTESQLIAYGERVIVASFLDGNTFYCTVI